MLTKFKRKWNIQSNFQLLLIMIIFSVTGSTSLFLRKAAFDWMGITSETSIWIKIPLYVLIIFPAYQILLLIIGSLFGQLRFAWEFEKKLFSRFKIRK